MIGNNSDKAWKHYGDHDPYFGVLTHDHFSSENIANHRSEFFSSGTQYIAGIVENIKKHLTPDFNPQVAVDFGCGVGRLTIPLAEFSGQVYGIDISEGMLKEAEKNREGITNISFVLSDDELSRLPEKLDFIHSYIVFQHIPVKRGMHMAKILVNKLNPGGIGALHFSYAIPGEKAGWIRFARTTFRKFPLLYKVKALIKGEKGPMMQMNEYNLNEIMKLIQEAGCENVFVQLTDHDFYGATFYFKK